MATEVLTIRLEDTGGPETRQSLERTGNAVRILGDRMTTARIAAGNFISEMAVNLVKGFGDFVIGTASAIDELGKFANQIGANIENLTAFRQVAGLAGVEFDKFQKALEVGTTNIQKAADGTGTAKRALEELQIPIQSIINLGADDQFLKIAGAMENVESETRRLALAQQIFGRGQSEVVRLLSQGEQALQDQLDAAIEMGAFFDQEGANQVAAMNDAIQVLTDSVTALSQDIVIKLAGSITVAVQAINDFIKWLNSLSGSLDRAHSSIVRFAFELFGVEFPTEEAKEANDIVIEITKSNNAAANSYDALAASMEAAKNIQFELSGAYQDQAASMQDVQESTEQLARTQQAMTRRTIENANAITGLVAAGASLAGIASPDQLGALLSVGGNLGTLFGASAQQLATFGAAASVGAIGGALVGGRGAGAGIGGALGGAVGLLGGPAGAAIGAILGGLIGGTFDSSNQPASIFGTAPTGGFRDTRGRIGQRTFVSPGALGNVFVGGRDGGNLTDQLIDFADLLSGLDNVIAGFVEGNQSRLESAQAVAQSIANETSAANFRPEENIRIRFQAIFDAIGGVESALFNAFSPSGEFVPQVIAAIAVLRDLGETSQSLASGFDATNDAFLQGVESLRLIESIVTQEDPIGTIRQQIADLTLTIEQQQRRQAQAAIDLALAYDGSIEATNEMAGSLVSLEQATAGVLRGIDAAQQSTREATQATITRIRQSGLTPEEIFAENRQEAINLRDRLAAGGFASAEAVQNTLSQINRLISSGFFGLSQEDQERQRENQIAFLRNAQEEANKQFEAQERRAEEQHQAALDAANAQLAAAAATTGAAEALAAAASSLSSISEVT